MWAMARWTPAYESNAADDPSVSRADLAPADQCEAQHACAKQCERCRLRNSGRLTTGRCRHEAMRDAGGVDVLSRDLSVVVDARGIGGARPSRGIIDGDE